MKRTGKIFTMIVFGLLALALTGCYGFNDDMGMRGGPKGGNRGMERLSQRLDLSKEQEKKMDDIHDAVADEMDEIHIEIRNLRKESAVLAEKDSLSEKDVINQFEKYKAIFTRHEAFFAKKIVEAHSLLTKEQKSEIKDIMD